MRFDTRLPPPWTEVREELIALLPDGTVELEPAELRWRRGARVVSIAHTTLGVHAPVPGLTLSWRERSAEADELNARNAQLRLATGHRSADGSIVFRAHVPLEGLQISTLVDDLLADLAPATPQLARTRSERPPRARSSAPPVRADRLELWLRGPSEVFTLAIVDSINRESSPKFGLRVVSHATHVHLSIPSTDALRAAPEGSPLATLRAEQRLALDRWARVMLARARAEATRRSRERTWEMLRREIRGRAGEARLREVGVSLVWESRQREVFFRYDTTSDDARLRATWVERPLTAEALRERNAHSPMALGRRLADGRVEFHADAPATQTGALALIAGLDQTFGRRVAGVLSPHPLSRIRAALAPEERARWSLGPRDALPPDHWIHRAHPRAREVLWRIGAPERSASMWVNEAGWLELCAAVPCPPVRERRYGFGIADALDTHLDPRARFRFDPESGLLIARSLCSVGAAEDARVQRHELLEARATLERESARARHLVKNIPTHRLGRARHSGTVRRPVFTGGEFNEHTGLHVLPDDSVEDQRWDDERARTWPRR